MIRPPRKLGRGDRLTATHYNALLDFVRRIMPLKGSGTSVDYTMGGARINAGGSAVGPVPELYPWKVVGGTDEGNAKLSIYLPQGSLVVADEEIEPDDIDGISSDEESPGYYTVDDLEDLAASEEDAQPLYLVIWRDDTATDPATNATVTLDPESVDGTVILQATIALVWASTVTTSEGDVKTYGAVATQLIRSAVHIGRGGGDAPSGSTQDFKYSYKLGRVDNKIYVYLRDKHLMIDGTYADVLNTNVNNTHWVNQAIITSPYATDVYLNITQETNGWSASFAASAAQGAKWSICIGHVERLGYAGANPVLNYVVGALILNSGNASSTSGENEVDVLTDVSYSNSSHKLTKTKQKVKVLETVGTETTEDVFTATDHANEHPNGL